MAIRATIKFTSILVNQVYFTKMVGTAHWKNLVLDDIQLNAERSVFFYADLFSFLESQQFSVSKGIADGVTLGNPDPIFSVSSVRSDNLSVIDSTFASFGKNLTNTVSLNEVQTFATGKGITDPLALSESIHTLLTHIRSFSHPVPMTETLSFQSGKTATDSITLPDTIALTSNKGLADSSSISDTPTIATSKPLSHPIYLYDSLVATRQPYNFIFSETAGVVSVTGEPTDSLSFSDETPAFNVGVSLQNYFALDDFAQVDKDVNGVKTNIVGFTETLGFGLDKSIPNEYVSLTDEPLFALSKSSSDSIIVSDSISYDHVVSSALLNRALLGSMILNAR
jgi:hypothetical protein